MTSTKTQDSARIDCIIGLLTKSQSRSNEEMSKIDVDFEKLISAFAELSAKLYRYKCKIR